MPAFRWRGVDGGMLSSERRGPRPCFLWQGRERGARWGGRSSQRRGGEVSVSWAVSGSTIIMERGQRAASVATCSHPTLVALHVRLYACRNEVSSVHAVSGAQRM